MQFISFTGYLTADPMIRSTSTGVSVCAFTVGVARARKNTNGDKESDFFRVNTWRQQADFCGKYLTKGTKVFVRGELQPSTYEGKDGRTRISLDVQADAVEIMSEKAKEKPTANQPKVDEWADISSKDLPWGD